MYTGRDVHRSTDMDSTVSKACKIGGLQNAGSDARTKQLRVPRIVVTLHDGARILSRKDSLETLLHALESLPVASRGWRVSILAIILVVVGTPVAGAGALDPSEHVPSGRFIGASRPPGREPSRRSSRARSGLRVSYVKEVLLGWGLGAIHGDIEVASIAGYLQGPFG